MALFDQVDDTPSLMSEPDASTEHHHCTRYSSVPVSCNAQQSDGTCNSSSTYDINATMVAFLFWVISTREQPKRPGTNSSNTHGDRSGVSEWPFTFWPQKGWSYPPSFFSEFTQRLCPLPGGNCPAPGRSISYTDLAPLSR